VRWLTGVFILTVWAGSGCAQPATIKLKSGEHDGFTRLVMNLPGGTGWRLETGRSRAKIHFDNENIEFDLSEVFDRIPRSRLKGISAGTAPKALILDLQCDCGVSTFIESGSFLVLDLHDAKQESTAAVRLPDVYNGRAYRFDDRRKTFRVQMQPRSAYRHQFARQDRAVNAHVPAETLARPPIRTSKFPMLEPDLAKPRLSELMRQAEDRMLDHIERATQQGILRNQDEPEIDASAGRDMIADPSTLEPNPAVLGLEFKPATTQPARSLAENSQETGAQACSRVDIFNFANRPEKSWFSQSLGDFRARLLKEPDGLDEDAAMALAALYLQFGFGVEAQSLLEMVDGAGAQKQQYLAISRVIQRKDQPTGRYFVNQQKCPGPSALWAALEERTLADNANTTAILGAFSGLPEHLKVHLGGDLAVVFQDANKLEEATAILRIVRRTEQGKVALKRTEAAIAEDLGDTQTAQNVRLSILAENGEAAVPGLIELVESSWLGNQELHPDIPEIVGSYALQFQGSRYGEALLRAEAISQSLVGEFARSREVLSKIERKFGPAAVANTLDPVVMVATKAVDDVAFLEMVFSISPERLGQLSEKTAIAVVLRLDRLGFSDVFAAGSEPGANVEQPESESGDLLWKQTQAGVSELPRPRFEQPDPLVNTGAIATPPPSPDIQTGDTDPQLGQLQGTGESSRSAPRTDIQAPVPVLELSDASADIENLPMIARARAIGQSAQDLREQVMDYVK
jgi:hypothetical protein